MIDSAKPAGSDTKGKRKFVYAIGFLTIAGLIIAAFLLSRNKGKDFNEPVVIRPTEGSPTFGARAPDQPPDPPTFLTDVFRAATGSSVPMRTMKDGFTQTTEPLRIIELPFGSALLTETRDSNGCHACTGFLGIYYFQQEGGRIKVTGKWPEAISGWDWGKPPAPWSFSRKFTTYPAIFAEGDFMAQGYICGGATLTELRPEGPVASELIRTSYTNEGAITDERLAGGDKIVTLKGRIVDIQRGKSFAVRVTGTDNFTERYVFRGKKFVPVAKSRLSC